MEPDKQASNGESTSATAQHAASPSEAAPAARQPAASSGSAGAAAASTAAEPSPPQAASASAAAPDDADDEDGPEKCPICVYIEEGPCASQHVEWRHCKRDAKRSQAEDWVEVCQSQVRAPRASAGEIPVRTGSKPSACVHARARAAAWCACQRPGACVLQLCRLRGVHSFPQVVCLCTLHPFPTNPCSLNRCWAA